MRIARLSLVLTLVVAAPSASAFAAACESPSPRDTPIWSAFFDYVEENYLRNVEITYVTDHEAGTGLPVRESYQEYAYGHALGRVASAVQGHPEKEKGFACLELGLEQVLAGYDPTGQNHKRAMEAAMGMHDDFVAARFKVDDRGPLDAVFDGQAPVKAPTPEEIRAIFQRQAERRREFDRLAERDGIDISGELRKMYEEQLENAQFLQHLRAAQSRISAYERCGRHYERTKETRQDLIDLNETHKDNPTDAYRQEGLRLKEENRLVIRKYKECYAHHLQGGPYEPIRKKGISDYEAFKESFVSYEKRFENIPDLDQHIEFLKRKIEDIDAESAADIELHSVPEAAPPEEEPPTRWCSCKGGDWNEFGGHCTRVGSESGMPLTYDIGHYTWTPDCHVASYKPAGS